MDLPACTVSSIGGCHTDVQKELEVLRRTMIFWWFQHVSTQIQSSFGELWAFVISKFSGKKKAAIMFRSWGNMRESESMENLCRIPINIYQLTWIKFYGRSPCSMGKSTISIAIFNSNVKLPEGNIWLVVWNMNFIVHILGMSSSQLTNSYFPEG